MSHRFTKEERLKSRRIIGQLFTAGQSFGQFPLRLVFKELTEASTAAPVQFALSVPRKRFKRAVDRNRLRRQIREAYRLHKHWLYRGLADDGRSFAFMVIYVAPKPLPYRDIEKAMQRMLKRFLKQQASNNH